MSISYEQTQSFYEWILNSLNGQNKQQEKDTKFNTFMNYAIISLKEKLRQNIAADKIADIKSEKEEKILPSLSALSHQFHAALKSIFYLIPPLDLLYQHTNIGRLQAIKRNLPLYLPVSFVSLVIILSKLDNSSTLQQKANLRGGLIGAVTGCLLHMELDATTAKPDEFYRMLAILTLADHFSEKLPSMKNQIKDIACGILFNTARAWAEKHGGWVEATHAAIQVDKQVNLFKLSPHLAEIEKASLQKNTGNSYLKVGGLFAAAIAGASIATLTWSRNLKPG